MKIKMGGGNISRNKTIFVLVSLLFFMIAIGSAAAVDMDKNITDEDISFDYTQETSDVLATAEDADSNIDISQNENKNLTDEKNLKASKGEVLGASNNEDKLSDSDYLKIRDSTGNTGTINVKTGESVTVEWWWRSLGGTNFNILLDGTKVSSLSTGYFDQGQVWENAYSTSFNQIGIHTIQIVTESGTTTSNTLTYNIQPSAENTSLEIYNPSDRTTNKFIYADQNSVTLSLANMLSADGKTASQLSSLIGTSKVTWYVDGVSQGTTNVGTTSAVSKSFTLSKGKHLIYATFAENTNLKGSTSNFIIVYVGEEPEEYLPSIILTDSSLNPDSHGVCYVPIMQQITAIAEIYNSTLGSNIKNYVYISNGEVLETAKFYYNYLYGTDITLSPNGEWNNGQFVQFVTSEIFNMYVVYEGNDLGLLPTTSNHLYYVVYTDTTSDVTVTPSSVGMNSNVLITPKITYKYADYASRTYKDAEIKKGLVEIYVGGSKVATVNAGETYSYQATSSGTKNVYVKYLGYDVDVNGGTYTLYKSSSSSSKSFTVSSNENNMWLKVNGVTEITITPDTTVTFTSDFDSYYVGTDKVYIYLNGEELYNAYYNAPSYYGTSWSKNSADEMTYSYKFTADNIGDNELYTYYKSGYEYKTPSAASNKVIVHVQYPERATKTTVTATPSETELGNMVKLTPTVKYGSTQITGGKLHYILMMFYMQILPLESHLIMLLRVMEYIL